MEKLITQFRDKCKKHNLNMTPQRIAIYQELIKSKDHPYSEDVFKRVRNVFPDISLDTVYRTLTTFEEIGLVRIVEGYGEAKRYDPDMNYHHHFWCRVCNTIIDFHDDNFDKIQIPRAFKRNFSVANVKVIIEGVCDKCAKRK